MDSSDRIEKPLNTDLWRSLCWEDASGLQIITICSHLSCFIASFYGDGYVHLRAVEASVQTLLHVRFRTSTQTGLLFLASGRRDFLLLELISGHMQVKTKVQDN